MVLLIALVAVCSTALAAPKQEVKTEILLQQTGSWNDIPYRAYPSGAPELTVKKMIIPPHTALPWHTHPAPNAAYILSGHLTVEDRATGRTAVYRAGQAFAESVNSVHRGRTDDEPAVVIVTYAGVPGEELSKPITPAGE
jgi:quercetin dioxygenase-like cupin family protein